MSQTVRIGNAHGFWGDRLDAAAEMLALEPDLDFLTLDFLAEVSMSILALQRSRDPKAGWPRDFADVVRSIAPYWRDGGRCRVVTNAGGLDPMGCAEACRQILQEAGCTDKTIAVVSGDDVLELVRSGSTDIDLLQNLDTGRPISDVKDRLVTANAYLGGRPIAEALDQGADLVITGRVADPSLTVGPCAHFFGWTWKWDHWNRLAGATVAGHLIECGTQVTGGIATDWLQTPDVARIGFPIAEVDVGGVCTVTKPLGTGGKVTGETVKEQLLYEIGDPYAYLSPDVTLSLLGLKVKDFGTDRVVIHEALGRPAPPTYKVSATYQDGFRAQGELTVFGPDAYAKARRAGEMVLAGLAARGTSFRDSLVECLGAGACRPQGIDLALASQLTEVVLRISVADDNRSAVERFARELMPLVTAGPPGTTGYAAGRPKVQPFFRYWPCLVARDHVTPRVEMLSSGAPCRSTATAATPPQRTIPESARTSADLKTNTHIVPRILGDLARTRSGDKGIHANIAVIARNREDFPRLCREITAARVANFLGINDASRVTCYEVHNLCALNFVIRGILANPLRIDVQGKALGQVLLEMPLENQAVSDRVLTIEQLGDAIVVLTLNRPERRNALSIELMDALCETLEAFTTQEQFRVVIVRGAGPVFCAGLDLHEAAETELAERSAMCVARTFQTLSDFPQVTIAAAHGAAYAGGAGLMACCDFVIASDDLKVCFPEVRRGLVPALATVALGSRMRDGDRRELLLLGEPVDARRALGMGLVDRVVPAEQLMVTAQEIAATVLKGGPHAVQQTKRLLRELVPIDRRHLFARALEFHSRARHGDEAREGFAAFHERREPNW